MKKHNTDKYCKRFGHWEHLVAMRYAQFSGTTGPRSLETGFNSHVAHHYPLGTSRIKRITLTDANDTCKDAVLANTIE